MATNVSFSVDKLAFVKLLVVFYLFVRKDDITPKSLCHQQVLTQSTGASTQNIVGVSRNNSAKGKNKVMNLCHVEEVCGHRIGDRVLSQVLRSFFSVLNHQFRVKLNWIITKLGLGDHFETMTSLGQESISLHPIETVKM